MYAFFFNMYAYMCVPAWICIFVMCQAPREGIRYSGTVVKGVVSHMTGVPGTELRSSASALTFDSAL